MPIKYFFVVVSGGVILVGSLLSIKNIRTPFFNFQSSAQTEPAFVEFKKLNLQEKQEKIKVPHSSFSKREIFFWNKEKNVLQEAIIPFRFSQNTQISSEFDLNKNSTPEIYTIKNGQLRILENNQPIWQSPQNWWVDSFFIADSDNDGNPNLNIGLWKSGSFGTTKPFWIKNDDSGVKNHFFVFNILSKGVEPVWQSSNLEHPNCEFVFADLDNDNAQELIVLEGEYNKNFECIGKYIAVWKWNEWGFFNEWRSKEGSFQNLRIKKEGQKNYLEVEYN